MESTPTKSKKATPQAAESYMVRFTCELVFTGDLFVTARKADAAKAARKQLATLDLTELSKLALRHTKKIRTGRIVSERAVREALAPKQKDEGSAPAPAAP
jgi:hypothetical protein